MPNSIIQSCARWQQPVSSSIAGADRKQPAGDNKVARIVVPYHPHLARGLQKALDHASCVWSPLLRHVAGSDVSLRAAYSNGGKALQFIARHSKF